MSKVSAQLLTALAEQRAREEASYVEPAQPDHAPKTTAPEEDWWPKGGPVARRIFNCTKRFILSYGERYSGKTVACLHRLVRHCYEHEDALAVVVTMTRRGATMGGPWETLMSHILPEWAEGIGLQGEGPNGEFLVRREAESQTPFIWIGARDGGWSRVVLISLQYGDQIAPKIKNMQFSFFFFDELTETDSDRFFLDPIQQLRRRSVTEKIYIAACNPSDKGEEHWVYQRWFVTKNQSDPAQFAVFHLPIKENIYAPDVAEYLAMIYEEGKTDPTAIERKIHGKWVKRPLGDGLLAKFFIPGRHVIGEVAKRQRLLPRRDWRVVKIGYDPGPANFNVSFLQQPPNREERPIYGIFDEISHVGDHRPYREIVRELLRKMNFWCEVMETPFLFQHVADAAAFNQRDSDGKYECRKIQDYVREELEKNRNRYPALGHVTSVRLRPCPKPPGSVPARVMMMQGKLGADEIFVSATCPRHIAMFQGLEENKNLPMHPIKDAAGYVHIFDACSYVIYYDELGGRQAAADSWTEATPGYAAVG